jgi:hypothetical protein
VELAGKHGAGVDLSGYLPSVDYDGVVDARVADQSERQDTMDSSSRRSPARTRPSGPPTQRASAGSRPRRERRGDETQPSVLLPAHAPELSPEAANALLRLLLDADKAA